MKLINDKKRILLAGIRHVGLCYSNRDSTNKLKGQMVHFCAVPGCSNRSNRNTSVSYYALPLKNKKLLKIWIHKIGRNNLPINASTRICSDHFVNAAGRRLQPDEYSSVNIPILSTTPCQVKPRKPPTSRPVEPTDETPSEESDEEVPLQVADVGVQASDDSQATIVRLSQAISSLEEQLHASKFCLENISDDDVKVLFYTGFPNYATLKICYDYLGPAVDNLTYWGSKRNCQSTCHGRNRSLLPIEEFYMILVRLRLGLFEKDLADRFNVSISTVSRICRTWITFLYMRFKELPLWASQDLVQSYMPKCFKDLYPSTRVIIDATEIFVETPSLPELQQMTFSSYKNHNTFKALVGISPGGAVTFVSKLFCGSISDRQLTKRSGLLELLQSGDSVMADRGFNIQDDLTPLGVRVNIPPFLSGKQQLEPDELVETRRIASLRIHVERAMERIKNFHIFDRTIPSSLTEVAEQMFFVCAVLTNFLPPLCS